MVGRNCFSRLLSEVEMSSFCIYGGLGLTILNRSIGFKHISVHIISVLTKQNNTCNIPLMTHFSVFAIYIYASCDLMNIEIIHVFYTGQCVKFRTPMLRRLNCFSSNM